MWANYQLHFFAGRRKKTPGKDFVELRGKNARQNLIAKGISAESSFPSVKTQKSL
jgi:hypothetical protein